MVTCRQLNYRSAMSDNCHIQIQAAQGHTTTLPIQQLLLNITWHENLDLWWLPMIISLGHCKEKAGDTSYTQHPMGFVHMFSKYYFGIFEYLEDSPSQCCPHPGTPEAVFFGAKHFYHILKHLQSIYPSSCTNFCLWCNGYVPYTAKH